MRSRKIHEVTSPSTESEDGIKWKQQAKTIIFDLKKELSHPSQRTLDDVDAMWRYQALLEDMLIHAVYITNQKYAYFEQKKYDMRNVELEYQNVSLKNKDDDSLKTFRREISSTIRKYTWYIAEIDIFSKEFIQSLSQLCEKWSQLSYIDIPKAKITKGKDSFGNIKRQMGYIIEDTLLPLHKEAFKLLKSHSTASKSIWK